MTKQQLHNLTVEFAEKCLIDSNRNLSTAAILAGVRYDSFHRFVKKNNLQFNNQNKPITATFEELQEAYDRLKDVKAVSKEFNASPSGMKRKMKQLGVKTNPRIFYTVDDDFFSRDTEEAFYWAGFIAADGNVNSEKTNKNGKLIESNILTIALQVPDKCHLERFTKDIKFNGPIKPTTSSPSKLVPKMRYGNRVTITSKKIVQDLKRFGITPRKSLTYICPDEILSHPLFHHFLRGYFDGDGSVWHSVSNKCLCFLIIGTDKFMNACRDILINNNIVRPKSKVFRRDNHFRLAYSGNAYMKRIYDYLYKNATVYLIRKYDKFQLIHTLQLNKTQKGIDNFSADS